MSIFSHRSPRSFKPPSGFTLIELVVVISIMVIVTSIILVNQSRFDSSTILRSLAYSVALSVRQAQVYGSSVVGTSTPLSACVGGSYNSTTCYAAAYGVHFVYGSGTYTLFADLNDNGVYNPTEAVKTFTFGNGYQIADLCATTIQSPTVWCNAQGVGTLDILFRRPNPEACVATNVQSGACAPGATQAYSQAQVKIDSAGDLSTTRSVIVTQTGEIEVCGEVTGSGNGC